MQETQPERKVQGPPDPAPHRELLEKIARMTDDALLGRLDHLDTIARVNTLVRNALAEGGAE
jgi:hypothetical protein